MMSRVRANEGTTTIRRIWAGVAAGLLEALLTAGVHSAGRWQGFPGECEGRQLEQVLCPRGCKCGNVLADDEARRWYV
jgi:hypothetical protein